MAYCTISDLITRYGETELIQLTDAAGTGMMDDARINAAIARSDADIDGALTDAGYSTPVVWARAQTHAEALTRYYLFAGARPSEVLDDFAQARKWLDAVSQGRLRPPDAVATPAADAPVSLGADYSTPVGPFDDTLDEY